MPAAPTTSPADAFQEDSARETANTLWRLLCGPEVLSAILALDPIEGTEKVTYQAVFTFTYPPSPRMQTTARDLLRAFSSSGPWGIHRVTFAKKTLRMLLVHKELRWPEPVPQCS